MKINKSIINEASDVLDKIEDKAEQELQSEAEKVDKYVYKKRKYDLNNLEDTLDYQLMIAERNRGLGNSSINSGTDGIDLLIEGPADIGKLEIVSEIASEIVDGWAKKNNINLVKITGSELTPGMIQGFVTNDFFKKLMEPRSVLFIDEINRSPSSARAVLRDLILSHEIPDANSESNRTYAENFLFTIAAQNPIDAEYYDGAEPFVLAMLTRFRKFTYLPTNEDSYDYFEKEFNKKIQAYTEVLNNPRRLKQSQERYKSINEGSLDGWKPMEVRILYAKNTLGIIDALRKAPDVDYGYADGGKKARERAAKAYKAQKSIFNARTLLGLLHFCRGDKDIFLNEFPNFCGSYDTELIQAVDDALANFTPIEDEPM